MKKLTKILNLITIVSLSSMALFILLIINYAWIRSSKMIENIYLQIIIIYGLPIMIGLCLVPMKMTASTLHEVGICRNHRRYQDVLSFLGAMVFLVIFLYQNSKGQIEGSYVLQFLFVGIGEEIFFRSILYKQIKKLISSEAVAIIIVSVIFGCLFHADGGLTALLLIRMPLSILFSIIYNRTGSLWIPIMLHGLYDVFAC